LVGHEDDLIINIVDDPYTDPVLVIEFVNKTGIDSLAIATGTAPVVYKEQITSC